MARGRRVRRKRFHRGGITHRHPHNGRGPSSPKAQNVAPPNSNLDMIEPGFIGMRKPSRRQPAY